MHTYYSIVNRTTVIYYIVHCSIASDVHVGVQLEVGVEVEARRVGGSICEPIRREIMSFLKKKGPAGQQRIFTSRSCDRDVFIKPEEDAEEEEV